MASNYGSEKHHTGKIRVPNISDFLQYLKRENIWDITNGTHLGVVLQMCRKPLPGIKYKGTVQMKPSDDSMDFIIFKPIKLLITQLDMSDGLSFRTYYNGLCYKLILCNIPYYIKRQIERDIKSYIHVSGGDCLGQAQRHQIISIKFIAKVPTRKLSSTEIAASAGNSWTEASTSQDTENTAVRRIRLTQFNDATFPTQDGTENAKNSEGNENRKLCVKDAAINSNEKANKGMTKRFRRSKSGEDKITPPLAEDIMQNVLDKIVQCGSAEWSVYKSSGTVRQCNSCYNIYSKCLKDTSTTKSASCCSISGRNGNREEYYGEINMDFVRKYWRHQRILLEKKMMKTKRWQATKKDAFPDLFENNQRENQHIMAGNTEEQNQVSTDTNPAVKSKSTASSNLQVDDPAVKNKSTTNLNLQVDDPAVKNKSTASLNLQVDDPAVKNKSTTNLNLQVDEQKENQIDKTDSEHEIIKSGQQYTCDDCMRQKENLLEKIKEENVSQWEESTNIASWSIGTRSGSSEDKDDLRQIAALQCKESRNIASRSIGARRGSSEDTDDLRQIAAQVAEDTPLSVISIDHSDIKQPKKIFQNTRNRIRKVRNYLIPHSDTESFVSNVNCAFPRRTKKDKKTKKQRFGFLRRIVFFVATSICCISTEVDDCCISTDEDA